MDTVTGYRCIIERVLRAHADQPYAYGQIDRQVVCDREAGHYLLMSVGREGQRRVHGCIIHLDIVDGKIWVQRDGTEYGVANELVDAGVPKSDIVLGFQAPSMRQHTEFAVT